MDTMVERSVKRAKREIIAEFPTLDFHSFEVTSPKDSNYNCAAYAAGDTHKIWDTSEYIGYWPKGVTRSRTIESFCAAFETLGYKRTNNHNLEEGIEKVAFFQKDGKPQHVALQLADGSWTSKLGKGHDICHELKGLEGDSYGNVECVLKRKRSE